MDWRLWSCSWLMLCLSMLLLLLPQALSWSAVGNDAAQWSPYSAGVQAVKAAKAAKPASTPRQLNEVSPYIDLALCPLRGEPWRCARLQSARILDVWDNELYAQWQKLKVEADRQLNATLEKRGYSASEVPIKEKPSTILKKIEIGTSYMKEYLAETMDGFLGREYEYLQSETKATPPAAKADEDNDDDDDDDDDNDGFDNEDAGPALGTAADDAEREETDEESDSVEEEDDDDDDDDDEDADDNNDDDGDDDDDDEANDESVNENEAAAATAAANGDANAEDVDVNVEEDVTKDTNVPAGVADENVSSGLEFIEIADAHEANVAAAESVSGQLKKPGKGGKRKQKKKKNKKKNKKKKNKNKKKKGQSSDSPPTTLVVVQAAQDSNHDADHGHGHGHGHGDDDDDEHDEHEVEVVSSSGGGHGHGKPFKRKQKGSKRKKNKMKRKGQHGHGGGGDEATVIVEHEPATNHLGLGLLEELVESEDLFSESSGGGIGGKRKRKMKPANYGRSNGVMRGKKKKKKKLLAKVALIGSFLKAKIELLLKILGAHLQIKFFAIALIGLLINIARFWIDVKRGGVPQKVVYVEHAHHQHHYEDHGGEDWSEPGGSYWKRSLHTDSTLEDADSSTDSYQLRNQQAQDAHYLAYRNQWQ